MTGLSTPRVSLRQWRASDREAFARLNADPAVMEFLSTRLDRAESDRLAQTAEAEIARQGWGLWAAELRASAAFIGFVGLRAPSFEAHFTPCIEIGWRLDAEHWNRGYATEGARAALEFGFVSLQVARGIERPGCFLLLAEWETLEDHTEGFRRSPAYQDWRAALHHFYDPLPVVEHYMPLVTA